MGRGSYRLLISGALPPLLYITFFVLLPIVLLIIRFPAYEVFSTIQDYKHLIYFNLFQAGLSALIATALGLGLSYVLARKKLNPILKSFVSAISKISFIIPGVSMAIGFFLLFGKRGILNLILSPFGLKINILYTFYAILLGHAFYNIPVTIFITGSAWEKLDGELIEAAKIDGAGQGKVFFSIELPLLSSSIISSYLLTFVYCFTSFAVVLIIGGPRYSTIEVAIYMYLRNLQKFNVALALTLVQMVIVAGAAAVSSILPYENPESGRSVVEKLKPLDWIFFWLPFSLVAVPLLLSLMSGFISNSGNMSFISFKLLFTRGLSFIGENLASLFKTSLLLAALSSLLSVSVSLGTSYFSSKNFKLFKVFPIISASISTVTLSFGYVLISLATNVPSWIFLPFLHSILALPLTHGILDGGWRSIPKGIVESSMIDGANGFQRFFLIYIPMMKTFILRALAFAAAISLSDLSGALILSEGKLTTLSMGIYRLMSSRHTPEAKALNTFLMLIVLSIFISAELLTAKEES